MNFFILGALFGVVTGALLAAFITLKLVMKSNDFGDNTGDFWDYSRKINVVEEVSDLSKDHPYVNAGNIFREHLAEWKAANERKKQN
ncbi:MAG: hypothetical protein IK055_07290 [Lachnospiraceae bacterium]|nr:hypothetical protein [Lachnospiraceae bacterium]MBR6020001.1 hypothetical protein [Lachnospiraceae bacterium]